MFYIQIVKRHVSFSILYHRLPVTFFVRVLFFIFCSPYLVSYLLFFTQGFRKSLKFQNQVDPLIWPVYMRWDLICYIRKTGSYSELVFWSSWYFEVPGIMSIVLLF